MARLAETSVQDYIASKPAEARRALKKVREAIRKALPRATEVISYQIPAYRLDGRVVVYFAGWKEHFSLYPATARVREELKKELAPYELSKGTIRFPLSGRVPVGLIARVAKLRARENAERLEMLKARRKKMRG